MHPQPLVIASANLSRIKICVCQYCVTSVSIPDDAHLKAKLPKYRSVIDRVGSDPIVLLKTGRHKE